MAGTSGSSDGLSLAEIPREQALAAAASQAQPLAGHGGDRTTEPEREQGSIRTLKRGETADYLLRRLARDAPEILERVKAGEFKSARAAAIEAGIIRPVPTVRLVDGPRRSEPDPDRLRRSEPVRACPSPVEPVQAPWPTLAMRRPGPSCSGRSRRLAPLLRRQIRIRPAAWVEQVVEGVRVLHAQGHHGEIPREQALAAAGAQAQPQPPLGTNQHREGGCDDVTPSDRGNSQAYLLRRLARDAPEILERVKAGEFRSARAAAIEAGIIKPVPTVRLVDDVGKVAAAIRRPCSLTLNNDTLPDLPGIVTDPL